MGTLVFQANLGGAVNLIGPNTASTVNFTLPSADGTNGQALVTNGTGTLSFSTVTTAAGGSNTQVQFNSGGAFAGSANLTFNGTTLTAAGLAGPLNGTVGATTPSTGAFTTLSASSTTTLSGGTANGVAYLNGSKVLTTGAGLVFDGSNLGLGVTPTTSTSSGIIQNQGGILWAFSNIFQDLTQNAYYNSGYKYSTTGYAATMYRQQGGVHGWHNAASGTAGNAITFTQAMQLDANGTLSIGTTGTSGSRITAYNTTDNSIVYVSRATGSTTPTTYPLYVNATSGGSNTASFAGLFIAGANGVGNSSSVALGVGRPATYVYHDTAYLQLYGGGLWQNAEYHWSTNGQTTYQGIDYQGCEFYNHRSDGQVAFTFYSANTSQSASIVYSRCARTTTNSTYNLFFGTNGNGTGQFAVRDSGNCVNTNNSYGSISDVKLKQDIVDASTQWSDIKNLRIRKFRWKSEVAENPNAKPYIGLIAQEAELVSPGLIEQVDDYEEFEEDVIDKNGNVSLKEDGTPHKVRNRRALGTVTKNIKYSILYMKAIKALQEAMDRIEQLESKVTALESKGV